MGFHTKSNNDTPTLDLFSFIDSTTHTPQMINDDEVVRYITDPVLPNTIDVLSYWKPNQYKFLILAKIACQLLQLLLPK